MPNSQRANRMWAHGVSTGVSQRRALILENGLGCVLPAARSLARAGWVVGLGSPEPNPRERGSRAVTHRHVVPRPEQSLDGFRDGINDAIEYMGYDLVLPSGDASMLALSVVRDRVHATVPYASHDVVLRAVDKLDLTLAAQAEGLAVPRTVLATREAVEACELPVVVKSRLHWTPGSGARVSELPIERCREREDVERCVTQIKAAGGNAILQQPITGRQIAVSVVLDRDGRAVAVSQQQTLGYSLAGTSTRAVTLEPDEALVDDATAVLRRLGWFGLANLQFLQPEGGRPHLIDLNGRFYGSLALAIAAGADLPAVWAACAIGAPPMPCVTARAGVRFHALEEDLLRARAERRGGLIADVARTLAFAPGAAHTLWSLRDPVPAMREIGALVVKVTRRLGHLGRSRRTIDQ